MKQRAMIQYPRSEKCYVSGRVNKIQVGMRRITLQDTVQLTTSGEKMVKPNSPLVVYDTSGAYSDPQFEKGEAGGLPPMRAESYGRRKDLCRDEWRGAYRAKPGKIVTQLYYAKKRIITPEMEYVAIRENQQVETLGLKSYITPEFVRKEVAAGRAVIPANINHVELEPMIIGNRFLVKVNSPINYRLELQEPIREVEEQLLNYLAIGCDTLTALFEQEERPMEEADHLRSALLRRSPIPVGVNPLLATAWAGELDWPLFRDRLIALCEAGVDFVRLYPSLLRGECEQLRQRLLRPRSLEYRIWDNWFLAHKGEENFLYVHFDELCEILGSYDVTLSLGDGMRAVSIYDAAADSLRQEELKRVRELVRRAWDHQVQTMVESAGHAPMDKIQGQMKEIQYMGHGAPIFTSGPLLTNAACGLDAVGMAIGGAQAAWQGASLLCCSEPEEALRGKSDTRRGYYQSLIMAKIAAHAADVAKAHPGAGMRDHAICKAMAEGNREADAEALSLIPKRFLKLMK